MCCQKIKKKLARMKNDKQLDNNNPASTITADYSNIKKLARMTQKQQYSGNNMFYMYFMYLRCFAANI